MVLAAVITFFFAVYFLRSRRKGDSKIVSAILAISSLWILLYFFEMGFSQIGLKTIFAKLQYIPITSIPVLWLIFILDYSNNKKYLKKSIISILCALPAATVVLAFTNEYHNLIWQSTFLETDGVFLFLVNTYGVWFWIWVFYAYLIIALSIIIFLRLVFSSIILNKVLAASFLMITIAPLFANIAYILKTEPVLSLDITPMIISFSSIILLAGLTRSKFKSILPVAKTSIIENMMEGVLVTGPDFDIIYINAAAEKLIGQKNNKCQGQNILKVMPQLKETIAVYKKEPHMSLSFEIGPLYDKDKIFESSITPMKSGKAGSIGNIIFIRDITKIKKIQELEIIKKSEERYKRLFENSLDGIYRSTISGKIVDANPSLVKMLGYDKKSELLSIDMDKDLYFSLKDKFSLSKTDKILEICLKDKKSNIIWVEISQRALIDEYGKTYLEGIVRDITDRKIAEEKVKWLTFHDKLTGLYNRAYFEEELLRLDTPRQLPLGVMMGDLNNLKMINDNHGHQKGDIILKTIAEILKKTCRTEDVIARWGGDEFVILLPKTDEANIIKVIARIRNNIYRENKSKFNLSLALGFAVKKMADEDINETIREAEKMMYKDKSNIKGRIEQQLILEI